ncbi:MAG: ABC transporter substrate-binding protein [Mangrovicoccus sp.]|nr:ABC transporter substrate-binding protein [Mangrovicoccus sp.]
MTFRAKLIFSTAVLALAAGTARADDDSVEVLHWWTAGGEAAALNVLKEDLEAQGIGWQDMPVAGGGGAEAMTVLRARVTSGDAPTAVQMLGFDILDWANQGALANLNDLAEQEAWDEVIPAAIQEFAKVDGKWVAAPVNVHSTNWVWANKSVLDAHGIAVPANWEELTAAVEALSAAGVTPIAHGGQPWQDATVFEAVLLSTGGSDFYKAAMIDLDPEALGSETMGEVFKRMDFIRAHVDENFSGRDWNLATAMVINGEAGFQMMGDWAKGEFLRAGQVPGQDFLCFRFPGTADKVTFNADQFAMFDQGGTVSPQQAALAQAVLSPKFQSAFNVVKGSVPARTDVSDADFDDCAKQGMKDVAAAAASGDLMGSLAHGYGAPASVKNAIFDVVTAHFNGEFDSESAVDELVDAVAIAQ